MRLALTDYLGYDSNGAQFYLLRSIIGLAGEIRLINVAISGHKWDMSSALAMERHCCNIVVSSTREFPVSLMT